MKKITSGHTAPAVRSALAAAASARLTPNQVIAATHGHQLDPDQADWYVHSEAFANQASLMNLDAVHHPEADDYGREERRDAADERASLGGRGRRAVRRNLRHAKTAAWDRRWPADCPF